MSIDPSPVPGLPDETYLSDGLVTKRHVRAAALAALRPRDGELLWDLGMGSGSVAIEWARAVPTARAVGVERDSVRAERAAENAERLAVADRVSVRLGDVADAVPGLPRPDAVFVGGGATSGVIEAAWAALPAGGRLVVHTVTIDSEQEILEWYRRVGGALTRLSVETAQPIGRFLGWQPSRPVVQWAATKPASNFEGATQ